MKRTVLLLAMLLMVATSYNQTSRRSASNSQSTDNTSRTSTSRSDSRSTTVRSSGSRTQQATPRTEQSTERSTTRSTTQSRTSTSVTPRNSNDTKHPSQNSRTTVHHSAPRRTTNAHVVEYKSPRVHRTHHRARYHYRTPPASREYRSSHHVYRAPSRIDFCWTPEVHRHFIHIYPMVHRWEYHNGRHFDVISAYDAIYYRGDVVTVYGEVTDVYYSRDTDEYFLYYGPHYPYHDFTAVMPGYLARTYSRNPIRYFERQHLAVSGLITSYQGEPEIYVKEKFQIHFY